MKEEIKNIQSGQGLGILKFGLSRDQVKTILGEPDEIDTSTDMEDEDGLSESWHYDALELSLGFDEIDDWRLVTIAVSSDNYEFKNRKFIGLEKSVLISELKSIQVEDLQYEDLSTDEIPGFEVLSSDSLRMNFWLEDDIVSEIQWGPFFKDENSIDWPQ